MRRIRIKGRNFTNRQLSCLVNPVMAAAVAAKRKECRGENSSHDIFLAYIETLDTIQNWLCLYFIRANVNLEKWVFRIYNRTGRLGAWKAEVEFEDREYRKYELEDLLNRIFYYAQDAAKEYTQKKDQFHFGLCRSFAGIMGIMINWLNTESIPVNFDLEAWGRDHLLPGTE